LSLLSQLQPMQLLSQLPTLEDGQDSPLLQVDEHGLHGMVVAFEEILGGMGVPANHIKTDYFPGFA
jgi:hypothetical protein